MSLAYISWQSVLWAALWLFSPLVVARGQGFLAKRYPQLLTFFEEITPWVYGIVPAFGAWALGLTPGRLLGFNGRGGLIGWLIIGLLLAGLWLAYWRLFLPYASLSLPEIRPDHALLPEPRWAFYRGIAWLWIGNFWWGMLLGFALSLLEWALHHEQWRSANWKKPEACFDLAARASSTLAFALSANLWFTMIFQAGLLWPLLGSEASEGQGA